MEKAADTLRPAAEPGAVTLGAALAYRRRVAMVRAMLGTVTGLFPDQFARVGVPIPRVLAERAVRALPTCAHRALALRGQMGLTLLERNGARQNMRQIAEVNVAGRSGLRALRDEIADTMSDLTAMTVEDDFALSNAIVHLGSAILFDQQATSIRLERTMRHIARSGNDHYQVRFQIDGIYHSECRGRAVDIIPGSINVCDTLDTERIYVGPERGRASSARSVCFFVQRALLAPWLSNPDAVGSTAISGETPYGALLYAHLVALSRAGPRLSALECEAAMSAAAILIAGGIGASADAAGPIPRAHLAYAQLAAIKRYIRSHLQDKLDAGALAARFGMSRAALYRLFAADNGVASYIQRCRLERAFTVFASPTQGRMRGLDVALECGFESESSFIRAFRRRFGVTPGALRQLVNPRRRHAAAGHAPHPASIPGVETWLHTLSCAPGRFTPSLPPRAQGRT